MRPIVETERLRLVALTRDQIEAILDGATVVAGVSIPPTWLADDPGEAEMLRFFVGRLRDDPALFMWRVRLMCEARTAAMVGHCGFHDQPVDGMLEMGYTVLPEHRRRGYATEAIVGLMDEAAAGHDVHRFRLSISPSNTASRALAERLGFSVVGEQDDPEDGLELIHERTWPEVHR